VLVFVLEFVFVFVLGKGLDVPPGSLKPLASGSGEDHAEAIFQL
jgi:hypothetical protein